MAGLRSGAGSRLGIAAALVGVYLVAATGIALDRAAPARPALEAWVPQPFRLHTIAAEAEGLRQAGAPQRASALAQQLVLRDPLSPQAAGLLGTVRLAQGNFGGAASAFRTSAKLGWRDAATQIYWFQAAMAAGDFSRAGLRFGAIAQQWPNAPAVDQLSAELERDPRGQANLAQRIAQGANWAAAYANPAADQPIERIAGRAQVLTAAGALGGKLGCDTVAAMVGTLIETRADLAGALWARQCPRATQPGQLADGGFEAQAGISRATAFDWQFPGDGALTSSLVETGKGGHALRLQSSAASLVPVAVQRLVLQPGTYRINWQDDAKAPRIAASLSCRPDRGLADPRTGERDGNRSAVTLVHAGGCGAPLLQLWLAPGAGEVTIDNVAIERR